MRNVLATALAAALALPSAGAFAQAESVSVSPEGSSTPIPVWNSQSGKLEAVLWVDTSTLPSTQTLLGSAPSPALGARWTNSESSLSAGLAAQLEPQFGLLCGTRAGALDRLGDNCLVTQLDRPSAPTTGVLSAQASTRIGRSEWTGLASSRRASADNLLPGTSVSMLMPELLPMAPLSGMAVEQNDLGIVGELKLGQQGWIRVGGSVARARLLPASSVLPGSVAPRWNSQTLSLGGGYGALGGEVVGRVVRVPGEAETYSTLGLGLTWRTPWAGRLTVGAQNLLSAGKNPVVRATKQPLDPRTEGRVPYVRYQQDL